MEAVRGLTVRPSVAAAMAGMSDGAGAGDAAAADGGEGIVGSGVWAVAGPATADGDGDGLTGAGGER